MISIKRYLNKDDSEAATTYERMARLLLQAMGLHAVQGDPADYEAFRSTIADVQLKLTEDPTPVNSLVMTGAAIKSLQDYNRRTSQFIRAQGMELQSMLGMLTQAMAKISEGSQTSIERLQELQKQIEHATQIEDIRTLKARLSDCLGSIHDESVRQRAESTRVVAELHQGMREARHRLLDEKPDSAPASPEVEPLSGVGGKTDAEAALRTACEEGAHAYAGLFIVDRLRAISSRFGAALADQVLASFLGRLSKGLTPQDRVFLWNPGSILVLLPRLESSDHIRKELSRILSRRIDQTFEIGTRSVEVPIASTWTIVPLYDASFAQVLRKLEVFTTSAPG